MKLLVLPGDGIGPEITNATLKVLDRANDQFKLGFEWQIRDIGLKTLKTTGSTLPDDVMEAARNAPGIILGPVEHLQYPPREQGGINPSGELRVKLDLFANIRPAKSRMGASLTGKPVDLVIFRECTEGFYGDRNMFATSSRTRPPRFRAALGLRARSWRATSVAAASSLSD
jgi:isocitrate/isopropylmalate dehydrogenase